MTRSVHINFYNELFFTPQNMVIENKFPFEITVYLWISISNSLVSNDILIHMPIFALLNQQNCLLLVHTFANIIHAYIPNLQLINNSRVHILTIFQDCLPKIHPKIQAISFAGPRSVRHD